MRKWINLVEGNSFADTVKAMSAHDAPAAQPGYGYTIDGDGYELTDDHVIQMKTRIEALLATNNVVYRYILLRPTDLGKYLQSPLGTFWCHDWDINVDSLTGWDTAAKDAELYRLTATVSPADVDMARTVVQNLACPWENEITVHAGSRIDLRSVDLLPNADPSSRPVKQPFAPGPGSYTA